MNADALTAERIGATWLRAHLAPACDFGRRAEERAHAYGPGDEVRAREAIAHIVMLAAQLDRDGVARIRAALRRAPDPLPIVSRARVGDPLGDVDFYELGRYADALDAIERTWDVAGGSVGERPPVLASLRATLAPGRTDGTFVLADAFAAPLGPARAAYAAADVTFEGERARLAQALAPALGFVPEGDEFILMRDAHPGVPPGVRVARETPAYRACALDLDDAALAADGAREAAFERLADAESAARRVLAERIARDADAIVASTEAIGELDRVLARVAFTQRWGGCIPDFMPDRFAFDDAVFAPLAEALATEGLDYTPLSLDLRGAAVLTGPNMGGKSAALALCGFLAACASAGVPPIATCAAFPLLARVAWIGGDEPAEKRRLLSSFGAEVTRVRDMFANPSRPEIFLLDEFARTTGPREGRALLVAVIEALAHRGAFALAATHYDDVARDAQCAHVAIAGLGERTFDVRAATDIHAALDAVAQAMDYRIIPVAEGAHSPSDALAVAALLGLDPTIINRAHELF
jgi:hypothetical protein